VQWRILALAKGRDMLGSRSFGAALAAITLLTPVPAGAAAAARSTVIPLSLYLGQFLSLDVSLHGRSERFLLDTGGGVSVVTPAFAARAGCKPWGQVTGFRMRGERLDLQRCDDLAFDISGLRLVSPTAGVWDLAGVFPKDAPPLAGSIALDALAGRAVTLDIAHRRLVVETPASLKARIRGATEVKVRLERDVQGLALTPLIAGETPTGRVWLTIDSGSDGQVIVNRPLAAALGLDAGHKGGQPLDMRLAGGVPVKTRALVQDLVIDGNIGAPVLRQWAVTIDLAHARMWLKPAA
jgi:predicted aspartyl protease